MEVQSRMTTYFNEHYFQMKESLGINKNFGLVEEDPKLEEVQRHIQSNTNPINFKHMMRPS